MRGMFNNHRGTIVGGQVRLRASNGIIANTLKLDIFWQPSSMKRVGIIANARKLDIFWHPSSMKCPCFITVTLISRTTLACPP